jgi:hypothetical protein
MYKLSHDRASVHQLVSLLTYAKAHPHSALWIPAILMILARRGGVHA